MKVPLYRLQGNGDHFYTTDPVERDNAVSQYGYTFELIACYVDTDPDPVTDEYGQIMVNCAAIAIGSIIQGRFYAGRYIGDPVKNIAIDSKLAFDYASSMVAEGLKRGLL